jgi:ubiquinone/menaquinone biosynthesis C-methylase UbiE
MISRILRCTMTHVVTQPNFPARLDSTQPDSTPFDSTRFAGAPYYYARYRPKYPQALYDRLIQEFNLNGQGRLLDLGCGTGLISLALHDRFEQAIAVDPDAEMLKEAKQEANHLNANNIIWLERTAEQLDEEPDTFKLITIGRAFHWMDRSLVIDRSYRVLQPGGGFVLLATHGEDPWKSETPWQQSALTVIKKWLGDRRRAGQGWWLDPDPPHAELLAQSLFPSQILYETTFEQVWTIDSFIGYLYSTAFCLRSFLGDQVDAFEAEIRETLLAIEPSGEFPKTMKASALIARK